MTPARASRQVAAEHQDGISIVRVTGEVDLANVAEISAALLAAVSKTAAGVVVDLSETDYLDSLGLHMLVDLAERLRLRRQELRLAVPDDSLIRKILRLTCLDQRLAVHPTVSAARASLGDVSSGSAEPG